MQTNGSDHLHLRKRMYKNLEHYPHPISWTRHFDYAMYFIGLLAPIALIPQAIVLYTSHDSHALSLPTWIILGFINLSWSVYGVVHREPPIAIANFFSGLINFIIAAGIIIFG